MIKVLEIVASMGVGGVETLMYNFYSNMEKGNVHLDFACFTYYDGPFLEKFKALGCNVFPLPSKRHPFKCMKALKDLLKENKYDCIHVHQGHLSLLPIYVAWRLGVKSRIAHTHDVRNDGFLTQTKVRFLGKITNLFTTHNFACTETAGIRFYGKRFSKSKKSYVMHNSIIIENYAFSSELRSNYRKQYNVENEFVIGCVARFSWQKNIPFLLEVFKDYHKINPLSKLIIVGDGEDFNETKRTLENNTDVILVGSTLKASEYYSMFDIFVLPSRFEGFGLVFLEAEVNGLTCITSDRVPNDADVGLMIKLSLNDSSEVWAREIEKNRFNERKFLDTEFDRFNIRKEAKRLEQKYIEISGGIK